MGNDLSYHQIVADLLEDQSWIEPLRLQGIVLDPDEGETVLKLAERIANVLTGRKNPIL